jgi:two-component system LytT family sensor kinase
MKKRAVVLRHVLAWLIYIGYEMSLIQITVGLSTSAFHYIVFYLLNIGLFYFNAHVILDFAFFKTQRPYLVSCALIAVEIVGYLFIILELDHVLSGSPNLSLVVNLSNEKIWLTNIWREIFFIGFSIAYWSMLYMVRFKERNHVMEREQLKSIADKLELENKYISAENAYLQNQISPHLLFNSLNFIYNTIHRLSDRAGKGVMLLADIMRYSLVSSEDNRTVLLGKEVEQIEKLIELSHLRFEEELFIKFRKKGKLADIRVLPLILITLVENMIKHGDLGDATNPAYIRLEQKDNTLVFVTKNKKRAGSPYPKGGLGLKNIEKRLVNFYPDRFTLDIQDKDDDFSATLILYL